MDELLSTREAAAILGVGTTTVKRWSDAGLLQCVKTPGKHRRFRREEVERFLRSSEQEPGVRNASSPVVRWLDFLLQAESPLALQGQLIGERARLGNWWQVAELIGHVLDELGIRWQRGEITVLQEHAASSRLSRALQRIAEDLPLAPHPRVALLATAEGEEHTLGLLLVELCIREAGLACRWAGRFTPVEEITASLARDPPDVVIVSASSYGHDQAMLLQQAIALGEACRAVGAELVLGGRGAWPDPPPYGRRLHAFGELSRLLQRGQ